MNKKREAPAASAAEMGDSKKRKMDGKRFYGVRAGFNPGVYTDWDLVEKTIKGFRDASFKKFSSEKLAQRFVNGEDVKDDKDKGKARYKKFYAVAVGHSTGIFTSWEKAKPLTEGVKGPKYKGFGTRAEAVEFIKQFGNREAIEALREEEEEEDEENEPPAKKTRTGDHADSNGKPPKNAVAKDSDVLVIYTDGSSLANGQAGSRAGLGVFFGANDPRNLSERLIGEPQTNQRAELTAIQRALEVAPLTQKVQICTDSQYSINCVTQWAASWERKGWKTAGGAEVKNQDIIRKVLAKMKERTQAGGETYFKWVKGHAADTSNIAADRLAVQGANMALSN